MRRASRVSDSIGVKVQIRELGYRNLKYSVLVKRIVNVRVDGIDTASQQRAIAVADKLEFRQIIGEMRRQTSLRNADGTPIVVRYVEDGDETSSYLVDEEGDEEFDNSEWYGKDGKTVLDPGNRCPECFRGLAEALR
jgi:hypothetical protein